MVTDRIEQVAKKKLHLKTVVVESVTHRNLFQRVETRTEYKLYVVPKAITLFEPHLIFLMHSFRKVNSPVI